ncbi:hypothetical protein SAMN05444274_102521 [Mariniphaga anaerophila]|uniref:Uncharacterized protein n=1 Tax=Mariniphaga anaerophila TaxID=1484053 RepID=A0A1M4WQD5_9BACT|nr:hypothetical protein SAMN05444274_102521 [Mariniphaga anaerophila]
MSFDEITKFQFQYGAINSKNDSLNPSIYINFNSSMVRLIEVAKLQVSYARLFQFQYGAINSNKQKWDNALLLVFQFQYGAINRVRF